MRDQQLLLAAVACLIASFALGLSGEARGYEISMYNTLSPVFWIALIGAFILFSAGLIRASMNSSRTYEVANLLGLAMLHLFMVALPALKYGTYYTGADVWFYLGQAVSIARTGHIDLTSNVYPSLDLIWVTTGQLTGSTVYGIGPLLGTPIEALRVPLVFVLVSRLFRNPRIAAFAAPLSAIPDGIVGTYPSPWSYSLILLLVLTLALIMRTHTPGTASASLAVIVATSFAISHPLGPIFLATAFAFVAVWSVKRKPGRATGQAEVANHGTIKLAGPAVYALVTYLAWIGLLTLVLQTSVSKLVEAFSAEGVVNPATYGRFFTAVLVLRIYGAYGILAIYWLAGLLFVVRGPLKYAGSDIKLVVSLTFSGVVMGLAFQSIASPALLGDFIQRPLDVLILFLPILGGLFLARLDSVFKRVGWRAFTTCGAIAIPFILGAAAMYPSPYIALFNAQNTQQLYSSISWSAVNMPNDATVLSNVHVGRYAYYPLLAGDERYAKLYNIRDTLPANLSQLGATTGNTTYMLLDIETVSVAGMDLRAWTFPSPQATVAIGSMPRLERIYDNGEDQIYLLW